MTLLTVLRARRLRPASALLLGIALVAATSCGASEDPGDRPSTGSPFSPYVALGDSYTAVSGTEAEGDETCVRSEAAYPNLLAAEIGISEVTNVACGGAKSENLLGFQYPQNKTRQDPQIDALSDETRLVTLGIGLNDENYSLQTVTPCFLLSGREQSVCAPFLARSDLYFEKLAERVGENVVADLAEIAKAAPNAKVVFVGYPRLLPEGKGCPSQIPLAPRALDRVRATGALVNQALARAARTAGVDYVDMYAASEGHDVCSKQPWINGQRTKVGEAFLFHPFPAYHEAVAEKLAALLEP